jgi:hypothetical protein
MVEKPHGEMSESGKESDSERDMEAAISTLPRYLLPRYLVGLPRLSTRMRWNGEPGVKRLGNHRISGNLANLINLNHSPRRMD